jgi:hypothetical protein
MLLVPLGFLRRPPQRKSTKDRFPLPLGPITAVRLPPGKYLEIQISLWTHHRGQTAAWKIPGNQIGPITAVRLPPGKYLEIQICEVDCHLENTWKVKYAKW